jgi:hypothetical protein
MHDIDRTQLEIGAEEFESDYEFEDEYENEAYDASEAESPFSEAEEMELAAELLEVTDEHELDQFLGGFLKKVTKKIGQKVGRFIPPAVLQNVGGYLKGAVKKALPGLATAVGTAIGGPAGGALAGKFAPLAGTIFGLELEGLSGEDQEYEVARHLVRFGGAAAQEAAMMPANGTAQATAQKAVALAAQRHAPGLIRAGNGSPSRSSARAQSGRWIRRGGKIIILGA